MFGRPARLVFGALLTCGACQEPTITAADLTVVLPDLAMASTRPHPTIRELNNGTVPTGTKITVSGVIIGPLTYYELSTDKKSCNYEVFIAQPDPTPTLHDGIVVVLAKSDVAPDMTLSVAKCKTAGLNEAISALVTGHALEINGTYNVTTDGERQVVVTASSDITDQGVAQVKPQPVVLDPKDLPNGNKMVFADAAGALVQFQNVTVSDINKYQDFMASTDGMNKATVASNFMTRQNSTYKAPADGSMLKSITGIVFPDFGGTVWARTVDDFVP